MRSSLPSVVLLALVSLGCDTGPADHPGGPFTPAPGGKADGARSRVFAWHSATNVFPATIEYRIAADFDANHCELYLDRFGDAHFSQGAVTVSWLEADLLVDTLEADILNVGMLVLTAGNADPFVMLADEVEPSRWRTGFTDLHLPEGVGPHDVAELAFFVDVAHDDDSAIRLWQSRGGRNYDLADAFSLPPTQASLGNGSIDLANPASAVFDQKRACQ